jgi:nucleoside-triphosphatase
MTSGPPGSVDQRPPVFIITGDPGEGKTSFLMGVLATLSGEGLQIRGIAAPGQICDDRRSGFTIQDLGTGISRELCSVIPSSGSEHLGRFYFRPDGLSLGHRALNLDPLETTDLLVIDEVGRFELRGAVWADSIDHIVTMPYPPMIWTVRRSLVEAIAERWPMISPVVVDIRSTGHEAVISELLETVERYRAEIRSGIEMTNKTQEISDRDPSGVVRICTEPGYPSGL